MGRTIWYDNTVPGFIADQASVQRNTGRQIDWAQVPDKYRTTAVLVKLNGNVSVDATSITVDALSGAIPAGVNLHFGEAKEFVRTTAAAAAGATSITVEAVPTALEDNDEAYYGGTGSKVIPAGTAMAELSSGKIVPRVDRPGSETATGLLASSAAEDDESAASSGVGLVVGGVIYENILPSYVAGEPWDTIKGELNTAGVGFFIWESYADDRS